MNGKIGRLFLIAFLLFIRPSSGFFKDKCNIDIDLPKLLEGKINAKDVIVGAVALLAMFQGNPSLEEKVPSTYKLVVDLVRTKVVTATHLTYAGTAICGAAVLLTSYCYAIHSRRLLTEAQTINNNLDIMIEAKVLPILQHIEGLLNGNTKDFCDAEIKWKEMLKDRILKVQTIRNDIKEKRQEAIESQEQIAFLALVVFATSLVALAVAAAAENGVTVTNVIYGVVFIITFFIIGCVIACLLHIVLGPPPYQQFFELLNQAEVKAIKAEEMLTLSYTRIKTECLGCA